MKKFFMVLLLGMLFIFGGCDNNSGPFTTRMEAGKQVIYSGKKPAKGWIQSEIYDQSGNEVTVYEMYVEKGVPAGDFKLYDTKGNLVVNAKGKWGENGFEGKIEEPLYKVEAKGIFAINKNFLISYDGTGGMFFSKETLIDGKYKGKVEKFTLKNNEFEGECITYNSYGNVIKCNYKNGILNGEYIEYHLNSSQIKEKYNYKNGILNGEYIRYTSDGHMVQKYNYENNKLNGEYIEYHLNGNVSVKCNYKNDKLNGEYIKYNSNGDVIGKSIYNNGYLMN